MHRVRSASGPAYLLLPWLTALLLSACQDEPAGLSVLPGATITVSPAELSLSVGESARLAAAVHDLEGRPLSGREVSWSSSAPDIVEVSPDGLVTALAAGVATVGAYSDQSVGFARVVVQMNFRVPVAAGRWILITEMGTPTGLCPGGEGGLRANGSRDCSHSGISRYSLDFTAQPEEPPGAAEVVAAADGMVSDVCLQPPPEITCGPNGPFVYVEHGSGLASFYSHLDPATVTIRRKTPVAQGEVLGRMGTWRGDPYPWVHFELRHQGQGPGENPVLDGLTVGGRKFAEYLVGQ
ncbi:MAG: peptidoglycan DD-metalloendopeptidase family protein [Gemmatimonadales bacterium]